MCGRFASTTEKEALKIHYSLSGEVEIATKVKKGRPKKRYNIAPRDIARVITPEANLEEMFWGLIPAHSSDDNFAHNTFNARAESLNQKPSFIPSLERGQRCLIPSDGFYEFPIIEGEKESVRILLPDSPLFSFAGLYSRWHHPDGYEVPTFTIITCAPNELIFPRIHNRMPVILSREDEQKWLHDGDIRLLKPFPSRLMKTEMLSGYVRKTSSEGLQCWESKPDVFGWL